MCSDRWYDTWRWYTIDDDEFNEVNLNPLDYHVHSGSNADQMDERPCCNRVLDRVGLYQHVSFVSSLPSYHHFNKHHQWTTLKSLFRSNHIIPCDRCHQWECIGGLLSVSKSAQDCTWRKGCHQCNETLISAITSIPCLSQPCQRLTIKSAGKWKS